MSARQPTVRDVAHEFRRLVQEVAQSVSAEQWRRRADAFDAAAPRIGDFHGRATREQLRARFERCKAIARACRSHADLLEAHGLDSTLVLDVDLALVSALTEVRDAA